MLLFTFFPYSDRVLYCCVLYANARKSEWIEWQEFLCSRATSTAPVMWTSPEESTTLREVVEQLGGGMVNGKRCKAVQIGGPSGGLLSAEQLDLPLHFQQLKPTVSAAATASSPSSTRTAAWWTLPAASCSIRRRSSAANAFPARRGHEAHERAFVGAAQLPAERGGLLPARWTSAR